MTYQTPTISEVGSVRSLTQAEFLSDGQDSLTWVFGLFGS
ncbi:lasso RiPP family leader peptide-containing protein [Angustibacter sp. Root456]|nr:lasso RiPP family leader peptide-containing protein [Angustibacter sp. Root456]